MTTEEALYWKSYIDRVVAEKLSVLNSPQQDAVRIKEFAESYMRGITGQQLLPQGVFRQFLEMFAHIPAMQGNLEQIQTEINETLEGLQESEAEIAEQAENINNLEEVHYPAETVTESDKFYHYYDETWAEETLGDTFSELSEDDIINALYDEFVGYSGDVNVVVLDFPHRGIASCSYILFKYTNGGPNLIGVSKLKCTLLSYDGYYTWNVRVRRPRGGRPIRTISNSWNSFALQTDTEQQRDIVVVENYASLLEIEEEERDTSVIYRTTDDDKLFLWNEEEFVEVGGGDSVDDIIYVTDLTQLFDQNFTTGVYTIAHNHKTSAMRYSTDVYSLVVNNYRIGLHSIAKLILSYSDGWAEAASDDSDNMYWDWHLYAYKDDVDTKITTAIHRSSSAAQRTTEKKEVVEIASYDALLQLASPQKEVIYVTTDTHRLYLYTDDGIIDATTGNVDNTIYVSSLAELISRQLSTGTYQVCHTYQENGIFTNDSYTLSVTETEDGNETVRNLILSDINGWAEVVDNAWVWHRYIYQEEIAEIETSEINALFN